MEQHVRAMLFLENTKLRHRIRIPPSPPWEFLILYKLPQIGARRLVTTLGLQAIYSHHVLVSATEF